MRRAFAQRSVRCENGEDAALLYEIIEEGSGGAARYGVRIVMRRGGKTECAAVRDITASRDRIRKLLAQLCENTVTPCTLRDVVEDALNKN